jgi:single-stranded DNA-binding protein
MDKPMQGIQARITGKVHEVKVPPKGPVVLVVRVSHGKDKQTGAYKPSSWYNVKVFAGKQAELAAANPQKDDLVTVDVWGATEEWTGQDGNKRSEKAWYLTAVQVHRDAPAPVQSLSPVEAVAGVFGGKVVDGDDVPF